MQHLLYVLILTFSIAFGATEKIAREPLIDKLRGVVVYADGCIVQRTPGVTIAGLQVPKEEKLKKALEASLGEPLTQGALTLLRHTILRHFHAVNKHLVMVVLPEQNITDGIVELVVIQNLLGEVRLQETAWSTPTAIADMTQTIPGKRIGNETLFEQVGYIDRHPFREARVISWRACFRLPQCQLLPMR